MIPNKNQRNTQQKAKIIKFLQLTHNHPTAEEVHKELKKTMPNISLATVYRNLNKAAQEKRIIRLEIDKEYHYDAHIDAHEHCICNMCGAVIDVHNQKLTTSALQSLDISGFVPESVSIIFRGRCQSCQTGGKNGI